MAENLLAGSLAAPGFAGLNTQDSGVDLSSGFATIANNCVIDKFGRIGARKGWTSLNDTHVSLGNEPVGAIHELVRNDALHVTICAGNNRLFVHSGNTLTELTYDGGGTPPTITEDNWQIVSLNGLAYFFQANHDPLAYGYGGNSYRRVSELTGYSGTVPFGNVALSAYGRLWVSTVSTNKNVIYFSDLKEGMKWTAGTSGSLDLTTVWPAGTDEIVALAAHNGYLIIFGQKQILFYSNASTPASLTLTDYVAGIGCIARDSVQNTGADILFLSNGGVRSLARTVQEKSMPMRDISRNVRDDLVAALGGETLSMIKSVYSDKEAFYLLSLPAASTIYCFDMRSALEDGSARVTQWDSITPSAMHAMADGDVLMGFPGKLAQYDGYSDNGAVYRWAYYTNWFDLGTPTYLKMIKKIGFISVGGATQPITVKWAYDYKNVTGSGSLTMADTSVSYYGIAQYDIAQYSEGVLLSNRKLPATGSGAVIQLGFEADINGAPLSVQKIDVFAKQGRLT